MVRDVLVKIQQLQQEKLCTSGEIKEKAVTNSLLVCNVVTQQLACMLHRALQVIALSQILLIFCMQCRFFAVCCPAPVSIQPHASQREEACGQSHWLHT